MHHAEQIFDHDCFWYLVPYTLRLCPTSPQPVFRLSMTSCKVKKITYALVDCFAPFSIQALRQMHCGDRETRTLTVLLPLAPEASVSTNSTISPKNIRTRPSRRTLYVILSPRPGNLLSHRILAVSEQRRSSKNILQHLLQLFHHIDRRRILTVFEREII